tara:strand:+ start:93 stop:692 length:600 start_codon:yes stop_codon:yes gene_type:complete
MFQYNINKMGKWSRFFDTLASGKKRFADALEQANLRIRNRPDFKPSDLQGGRSASLPRSDATELVNGKGGLKEIGAEMEDIPTDAGKQRYIATNSKTPPSEVDEMFNDPRAIAAATSKRSDLAKFGLKGVAGVAVLMILTGEKNPLEAIKKALAAARDAAKDGLDIFKNLLDFFTNYGVYMSVSSSCLIMLLVSVMLLK